MSAAQPDGTTPDGRNPGGPDPVRRGPIVVGIEPEEPTHVLFEAARFARELGVELVCAHVDTTRYPVEEHDDGSIASMPLDPEVPDLRDESVDPRLEKYVTDALADAHVSIRVCALAGDPAQALGRLAESLDARAIVVGTRHPSIRAGVEEFFRGSIAIQLAHRQNRPVIVIPLKPHPAASPWELEE
jgi:nucleotide-binding universal stress UspA family protein